MLIKEVFTFPSKLSVYSILSAYSLTDELG